MQLTTIEFKSECLELMERLKEYHEEIVITKYGKPIAKLVPIESTTAAPVQLFGFMKGSVKINGDIIEPIDEAWDAVSPTRTA
ncbi:MAG: type II toxin-antitoxin system prevent-host-death family antitoxin [bacterium]|nr:type II toxin-antitoxin system prevent-host-death family antitoxin [bacterium]